MFSLPSSAKSSPIFEELIRHPAFLGIFFRFLQLVQALFGDSSNEDESIIKVIALVCAADGLITDSEKEAVSAYIFQKWRGERATELKRTFDTYSKSFLNTTDALHEGHRWVLEEFTTLSTQKKLQLSVIIGDVADADGTSVEEKPVLHAIFRALLAS